MKSLEMMKDFVSGRILQVEDIDEEVFNQIASKQYSWQITWQQATIKFNKSLNDPNKVYFHQPNPGVSYGK